MTLLPPAHTALHTLARLNQVVSSSLDMDKVLHEIVHAAAILMDTPFVQCLIADEATRTLESRAFSEPQIGADYPIKMVPFSEGGLGWVATHRRPLQVADVFTDGRFMALDWWRAHGLRSFLGVPMVFEEVLLGVLALSSGQPLSFGPDEQYLLDSFVAQAAIALNNARLFSASQRQTVVLAQANAALQREIAQRQQAGAALETRALQQAVLVALGQRALRDTNVTVLIDEVVRRVAETLDVDYCAVFDLLPDENTLRIRTAVGLSQELIGQATLQYAGRFACWLYAAYRRDGGGGRSAHRNTFQATDDAALWRSELHECHHPRYGPTFWRSRCLHDHTA